jgi:hypothetical protein
MPTHSRKRSPPATRRRALELVAASSDGRTEAILIAHGFKVDMLVKGKSQGVVKPSRGRYRTRVAQSVGKSKIANAENDRELKAAFVAGPRARRVRQENAGRDLLGRVARRSTRAACSAVPPVPPVPPVPSVPSLPLLSSPNCPTGHSLGTVPWDTSLFLVIVVHDELEAALHCRLGKPGPIGDVSDALPLPAQSFERIEIISRLDRGYRPLIPEEPRLEGLGIRPIEASGLFEMNLEASALLG